ncbi:MAG: hypothetical protein IT426_14320 [Pirellulales bacterium]|nr:hypothetical protein [Pirellulales bacterium]
MANFLLRTISLFPPRLTRRLVRLSGPFILPLFLGLILGQGATLWAATGQLELTVIDKDTGKPIPCRMHLLSAKGQPRRVEKTPFWNDHFALPGKLMLKLPLGNYTFVLERGLEYLDQSGSFAINVFADDAKRIELRRFADLAAEGWYGGDLDIRRPTSEIELLMLADDLHLGEVVTWGNVKASGKEKPPEKPKSTAARTARQESRPSDKTQTGLVTFDGNRCYRLLTGIESRAGGEIIYHRLSSPIKLAAAEKQSPSLLENAIEAKKQKDAWIEIANPSSWDMPALVALKLADSIQLAGSRLCREKVIADDGGRPRDKKKYPDPLGGAKWSQELYFRLLECGLRIPPTAGSGSGAAPNPVGFNRVYVNVEGEFGYGNWWENLRAGRAFVTNGPLLRASVEGRPPGHVFAAEKGQKLDLEIALALSTREEIHYLEVVKNGAVEKTIRMDEYVAAAKNNRLPKIEFEESGWFLLRAVCDSPKSYRFALTAPYFVVFGDRPRISKKAAQFFLDWIDERAKQIELDDPQRHKELLGLHRQARDYWKDLTDAANAE